MLNLDNIIPDKISMLEVFEIINHNKNELKLYFGDKLEHWIESFYKDSEVLLSGECIVTYHSENGDDFYMDLAFLDPENNYQRTSLCLTPTCQLKNLIININRQCFGINENQHNQNGYFHYQTVGDLIVNLLEDELYFHDNEYNKMIILDSMVESLKDLSKGDN